MTREYRDCWPHPCRAYHGTYAHTSGEDPCRCPCHEAPRGPFARWHDDGRRELEADALEEARRAVIALAIELGDTGEHLEPWRAVGRALEAIRPGWRDHRHPATYGYCRLEPWRSALEDLYRTTYENALTNHDDPAAYRSR